MAEAFARIVQRNRWVDGSSWRQPSIRECKVMMVIVNKKHYWYYFMISKVSVHDECCKGRGSSNHLSAKSFKWTAHNGYQQNFPVSVSYTSIKTILWMVGTTSCSTVPFRSISTIICVRMIYGSRERRRSPHWSWKSKSVDILIRFGVWASDCGQGAQRAEEAVIWRNRDPVWVLSQEEGQRCGDVEPLESRTWCAGRILTPKSMKQYFDIDVNEKKMETNQICSERGLVFAKTLKAVIHMQYSHLTEAELSKFTKNQTKQHA